jgi:hypothetical protein
MAGGFFSRILGNMSDPYPWNWEFQRCFVKNWEKMHEFNFAKIKLIFYECKESMSRKQTFKIKHLQTFKHHNSEEALIFKDFRICYSIFLFCNFQLGIFS